MNFKKHYQYIGLVLRKQLRTNLLNSKKKTGGGTRIQSERYEIHLNFEKDQPGTGCWKNFCARYDYNNKYMEKILEFVTLKTKHDLGPVKFRKGKIATPALIICKTEKDQTFHLDLMGSNKKQYGMVLSPGATTTTICKPISTTNIKELSDVTQILKQATVSTGLELSDELLQKIDSLSTDSASSKTIKEGYGELFRVCRKDHKKDHTTKDFDWTSTCIVNAQMGTYYSVEGGIIHAGSGARNGDVRVVLFWTWNESNAEEYNRDRQETKLTLIVSIAKDVWSHLDTLALKQQMIELIYYCFWTCEDAYQLTAATTFNDYPQVVNMIQEFMKVVSQKDRQSKNRSPQLLNRNGKKYLQSVVKEFSSLNNLWEMQS